MYNGVFHHIRSSVLHEIQLRNYVQHVYALHLFIPSLVVFEIHSIPFQITYGVVDIDFVETLFNK